MSLKASMWAWEVRDITPTQRLVLLRLADQANDDGECWPSKRSLAEFTGLDRRTVTRAMQDLRAAGLLTWEHRAAATGRQTSSIYTLAMHKQAAGGVENEGGTAPSGWGHTAPPEGGTAPRGGGHTAPHEGGTAPPLESLKGTVIESTRENHARAGAGLSTAPPDLQPRLVETWREIVAVDGVDVANRAIGAARLIFRGPSPAQVLETWKAAAATGCLNHQPSLWPDFRRMIDADKRRQSNRSAVEGDEDARAAAEAWDREA